MLCVPERPRGVPRRPPKLSRRLSGLEELDSPPYTTSQSIESKIYHTDGDDLMIDRPTMLTPGFKETMLPPKIVPYVARMVAISIPIPQTLFTPATYSAIYETLIV